MKRIVYLLVFILFLATSITGCRKDDASAPVPVEGLKAYAGKNRAKLEFHVPANAKTGKVFFGNGNFQEFEVSDPAALQSVIVEGLSEEEQILRVITMNSEGVNSNPKGVKVKVYGSTYQNALKPRKWLNQVNNSATSIELLFDDAFENETKVWVVFTNTAGTKDSVSIENTLNTIQVNNIDTSKTAYYYSAYKPAAEVIDEFQSASVDLKDALMLNFTKQDWIIAGMSGSEEGKGAEFIIDNDAGTSWHSTAGVPFPQWVSVDMGTLKLVDGFYYLNHQGNGNFAKKIRFEVSNDNTNWTQVLETDVSTSYLRQRLPLSQSVKARYFKVTVIDSWNPTATKTQFAEIDVFNVQNISAENGKDSYTTITAIPLVNATRPFTGDGSTAFPALGESPAGTPRMQKMKGWTHSPNAIVTYDNFSGNFSLFIAAVWGLPEVENGKIHQSVNLQPGQYRLKVQAGTANGPADIYGVVTGEGELPDYTSVLTDANIIKYLDLMPLQNKTAELYFAVEEASSVNIGFVYNVRSQYSANGTPFSSFDIQGLDLEKVE